MSVVSQYQSAQVETAYFSPARVKAGKVSSISGRYRATTGAGLPFRFGFGIRNNAATDRLVQIATMQALAYDLATFAPLNLGIVWFLEKNAAGAPYTFLETNLATFATDNVVELANTVGAEAAVGNNPMGYMPMQGEYQNPFSFILLAGQEYRLSFQTDTGPFCLTVPANACVIGSADFLIDDLT